MKNRSETYEELLRLAFQIGRLMRGKFDGEQAKKLHDKVSAYQIQALFAIRHEADTTSKLAEEMGITLPSATSLVDRLVKSGLIIRTPDPEDRRVIRLTSTDEGNTLYSEMKQKRKEMFKRMLENLSDEDVESLHRILTNLQQSLEDDKQDIKK